MGVHGRRARAGAVSARAALAGVALLCLAAFLPAAATAAAGALDPSFGNAGETTFGMSFHERVQVGRPATVAFTGNGEIELMGTATGVRGGSWRMFAARLREDGALDPTFGSGGSVITRLPSQEEETNTIPVQSIYAGALEADGAMVGVGPRVEGRLSAAGAFDPSFANQLPMNAYALVELANGQMLVAGETPTEGEVTRYPTLERLLANGAPDPSFGTEGLVRLPDRAGASVRESAHSMLALANGELLVAGVGEISGEQFGWLAQVSATGALDRSFGDEGVEYVPAKVPYLGETGLSIAREPDGTIVLSGAVSLGGEARQAAAWEFLANGTPDTAFGNDGVLLLPRVLPEEISESVTSAADNSGYVYIAVRQVSAAPSYSESSYVARLTPAGELDSSYGANGLVSFPTASIDALGVDPDGRLLVAGAEGEAVFLARLLGAQQSGTAPSSGGSPGSAHPLPTTPAKVPLISEHVSCARVRRGRHRGAERCALRLKHVRGSWKSALVLVDRRGHRIAQRQLEHLRLPLTLVFYLRHSSHSTSWTVLLRDGRRVARSSPVLVG
jgi:uncharacterized delta-60 repeat protein